MYPSLSKEKVNPLKHYYYYLMGFLTLQKNIETRINKSSNIPLGKHPLSRYKSLIFSSFENSTILVDDKNSNKSVTVIKDGIEGKLMEALNPIEEDIYDEHH